MRFDDRPADTHAEPESLRLRAEEGYVEVASSIRCITPLLAEQATLPVFAATRPAGGLTAQAWLPYGLPPGLQRTFVADRVRCITPELRTDVFP